jgi:hypothetical protein
MDFCLQDVGRNPIQKQKANMHSLMEINNYIDQDFDDHFNHLTLNNNTIEDKEEAIEEFEKDFEERYNTMMDNIDLQEIKEMLDFNKTMIICRFVKEQYEEFGTDIDSSDFGDKLLRTYIYFYLIKARRSEFIEEIEKHYDGEWVLIESEESEDETEYGYFMDKDGVEMAVPVIETATL